MGIELFLVFLYYLFNVQGICSDVPSFISDISNLCPFSFSLKIIFIYLFGCAGSSLLCGFSLVVMSSVAVGTGFLLQWLLLSLSMVSRV